MSKCHLLWFLLVIIQTTTFVNSQVLWTWEPNVVSARAAARIVPCDINNDSFLDLVITGTQSVYVLYGNSSGSYKDAADQIVSITTSPGSLLDGLHLECADVNADGYADAIVGNWTNSPSHIHIYNGSATGLILTPTTISVWGAGWYYGYGIEAADFNGDGFTDLAVGMYGLGNVSIYYSMGLAGINTTATLYPVLTPATFSFGQVIKACDFSQDGFPDLVVSIKSKSDTKTNQGQVWVISGTAAGFENPAVTVTNGSVASAFYGTDLACADINGDGHQDLLVLSTNTDRRLFIYYGTGDIHTLPKTPSLMMNLTDDPRCLLCTDLNGDGMDDILVGYNQANRVRLYYGSTNLQPLENASYVYTGPGSGSGWTLAALGNLDLTGQAEFAVGTYAYSNGQNYEGRVAIMYDLPASPSPSPSRTPTPSTSPTPSITPSSSPSASITPSSSPSVSVSPSRSPSVSVSPSSSPSASVTPSTTPSSSCTPSISTTPTASLTPSSSPSASPSTNYLIKKEGNSKTVVMAVAIAVPIMSLTILGSVLLVLFYRNKNKKRADVELPGKPGADDDEGCNYVTMKSVSSFATDSYRDDFSVDGSVSIESRKSLNLSLMEHNWDIPYGQLRTLKVIGTGAFGQVFKARWQGVDVAVKQILTKTEQEEGQDLKIQDFFAEAELMRKLKPHPNITQLLGVCMFPLCIVTEFVDNGSLFAWIHSGKPMEDEMKMKILRGTAAGMTHLHAQGVIHRDLAARNILLDSSLRPKVCDFGMSRITLDNRTNKTDNSIGPIKWMAPEALTDRKYNTKTDVWSFGVVIYEILARKSPYSEYNLMQIGTNVAMGKLSLLNMLENPDSHPAVAVTVFKKCLEFAADNRPEFQDIIQEMDA